MDKQETYPKVRWVTRADRKRLSALIIKFTEKSGSDAITRMVPRLSNKKPNEKIDFQSDAVQELILSVMKNLFEWVDSDMSAWIMDIIGCATEEEFDAMPFDIEMYVVEELLKQKGFKGFFLRASNLFNMIPL